MRIWTACMLLGTTLLTACATTPPPPPAAPKIAAVDGAQPFSAALRQAIESDAYYRYNLTPLKKTDYLGTIYTPRDSNKLDRGTLKSLVQDWCDKNGGTLTNDEDAWVLKSGQPELISSVEFMLTCSKDGHSTAAAFLGHVVLFMDQDEFEKVQLVRNERAKAAAAIAERDAAAKRMKEEVSEARRAKLVSSPELGDRVSIKVCRNPYGGCGSWQLSRENGEIMEIREAKVLVRTFGGNTHWVNKGDLFAPE